VLELVAKEHVLPINQGSSLCRVGMKESLLF
jgi:hypothetical protein